LWGFSIVVFVVVGFLNFAGFFVGFFLTGLLVVGLVHFGGFIIVVCGDFCFCCGGSSTLIESCLLWGVSPGLPDVYEWTNY
jgi:hypothetical protein